MKRFMTFLFVGILASAVTAQAAVKVPKGNRSATQPKIPGGSVSRTNSTNTTFEAKYEKIRDLIADDKILQGKIKHAAKTFEIDPIHIVGALVGEHTYNVDAIDRLQSYYVKAISYLNSEFKFAYDGESVEKFVERPEFAKCKAHKDSYELWGCRETVWNTKFKARTTAEKSWPNNRFGAVFFQPFFAGQTFGLGQINPLTALRVTDFVAKKTGARKLSSRRANEVYKTIMNPDSTLLYMAAVLKLSIDSYRDIAGFDISGNPGVTATLYNLGDVRNRAQKAKRAGRMPRENYYGWLVNEKQDELEAVLK